MIMRGRPSRTASHTVDAVLVTAMGQGLAILLTRNSNERERWSLPWRVPQTGETLDSAATLAGTDRRIWRHEAAPE
jgi:ADP-ribose pyrophosphatase YjhB (NUDIX family)